MSVYKEPCLCGSPDCVRCFGESARFYGWCDGCPYMEEGECDPETVVPGSDDCQMQEEIYEDRASQAEERMDALDRARDEKMER